MCMLGVVSMGREVCAGAEVPVGSVTIESVPQAASISSKQDNRKMDINFS